MAQIGCTGQQGLVDKQAQTDVLHDERYAGEVNERARLRYEWLDQ